MKHIETPNDLIAVIETEIEYAKDLIKQTQFQGSDQQIEDMIISICTARLRQLYTYSKQIAI